jgi:hypothetical protein
MKALASEHVTLVEALQLTRPFEEFTAAIQAAGVRQFNVVSKTFEEHVAGFVR